MVFKQVALCKAHLAIKRDLNRCFWKPCRYARRKKWKRSVPRICHHLPSFILTLSPTIGTITKTMRADKPGSVKEEGDTRGVEGVNRREGITAVGMIYPFDCKAACQFQGLTEVAPERPKRARSLAVEGIH